MDRERSRERGLARRPHRGRREAAERVRNGRGEGGRQARMGGIKSGKSDAAVGDAEGCASGGRRGWAAGAWDVAGEERREEVGKGGKGGKINK